MVLIINQKGKYFINNKEGNIMKTTTNNLIIKLVLKIYYHTKEAYLKKILGKFSLIVEEEDKIFCYVNQELLDKHSKNQDGLYNITLNGINIESRKDLELADKFKINKPVYYIFKNIIFSGKGISLSSKNVHILFKNCAFEKNIDIKSADNIVFENNRYFDCYPIYINNNTCFFNAKNVKKLTFRNENFSNRAKEHPTKFGMNIEADEIKLDNIKIYNEHRGPLNIKAKKISINHSSISARELYIDSKSIDFSDSAINAKKGIIIDNKNCDFRGLIESPYIIYNGIALNSKNEPITIDNAKAILAQTRQKLINKLKELSNYCHNINTTKAIEVKHNLDKQTITRTLKRR